MASADLVRTISSNPTLATKATISYWCKRSKLGSWTDGGIAGGTSTGGAGSNNWQAGFIDTDKFYLWNNTVSMNLISTRVARDVNAWYHVVWSLDSTQGTAADRAKLYVNGEQVTVFDTANYPTQNGLFDMARNGNTFRVGKYLNTSGNNYYFDGQLAHFHFVDGITYPASTFGETDTTTGIWKPKTSPSVTYGTNGLFLKFDNSGNMGLDSGGGSNNLTTSGTIIQNKDTPSNVFAVLNPLASINDTPTFSNTNNTIVVQNASAFGAQSTLGMSKGKYYAEFKMTASSDNDMAVGVNSDINAPRTDLGPGFGTHSTAYRETGTLAVNGSDDISYGNSYAVNDIVGIAIDLDNNKLYFSKNGVFQNSGVPTSGSTGTGARSITAADSTESGFYFFNAGSHSNTQGGTWQANFGNGYFGTSAVASAQSPDDGNGIFEYDVPAGYRALCTKSLNAQEYS